LESDFDANIAKNNAALVASNTALLAQKDELTASKSKLPQASLQEVNAKILTIDDLIEMNKQNIVSM
jgi:hypothetical protein